MSTTSTGSTSGRVLVTGATGDIGGLVASGLADHGVSVRVMCRRQEQVDAFSQRGVEAALGSFEDPRSLRQAMANCEQLFLLPPDGPDQLAHDRVAIDAALQAGVQHVVKISTLDANPRSAIPWARDHALADTHLSASGLAWTRLQPGAFMKNLLTEAAAVRRGWLPQTSGHGATTWIDVADIADVAVRVLTDPSLRGGRREHGRAYVLTGTRATSYPEIAETLTEVLGRRVRYLHMPSRLFELVLRAAGTSAWQARGLRHQFVDVVRKGHDNGRLTSTHVVDILDREPTSWRDFIEQHRDELQR